MITNSTCRVNCLLSRLRSGGHSSLVSFLLYPYYLAPVLHPKRAYVIVLHRCVSLSPAGTWWGGGEHGYPVPMYHTLVCRAYLVIIPMEI